MMKHIDVYTVYRSFLGEIRIKGVLLPAISPLLLSNNTASNQFRCLEVASPPSTVCQVRRRIT